jgi:ATP-dependent Clp protease ATP-binding subunit ClpB
MQPNDPQQFTEQAWQTIARTLDITTQAQQQFMETEQLLKALLEEEGLATQIFSTAGINVSNLRETVDGYMRHQPIRSDNTDVVYLGGNLDILLDRAENLRKEFKDGFISIEHLVLAYAQDERIGKQIFSDFQLSESQLKTVITQIRGSQKISDNKPESQYAFLTKYGRDLTEAAKAGKLDPVIGRDEEIFQVIQILSRRTKAAPLLLGEIGVGKTSIVEELSQRIVIGDVPPILGNLRIITLNLGALMAGASQSEFEARLEWILQEASQSDGEIILFVDDIHEFVCTDVNSWTRNAGKLLQPMMQWSGLRCIGASTVKQYQKLVDQDLFLERCFSKIVVASPSIENAVSILRGLKERYELHHGVKISDDAVMAAVTLSERHITDRFLPDKAIDLMDEAAAKLKIEITFKPEELDKIDRKILQMEMERRLVKKDSSSGAGERLEIIEKDLANDREQQGDLHAQWQLEKDVITMIQKVKEEIDRVSIEVQQAERDYDLNRAAELKYGKLTELYKQLEEAEIHLEDAQITGESLLRKEVTVLDIAKIIAKWTGLTLEEILPKDED